MPKLPSCPHCKLADEVYTKRRVTGYAHEYFTIDGEFSELNIEHLDYARAMVLRCAKCGHIRHDIKLLWDDNEVTTSPKVVGMEALKHDR